MRYIIGFLVTIGLIVLIIVLLLQGSGGNASTTPKSLQLTSYANSATATASYLVDGPIEANQDHYTMKIDVSQNAVTANVYQGYDQTPLRSKTYANNSQSFAVFMHALDHAGFTKGNTKGSQDERGYCPTGQRVIYQLTDGTKSLMRFWRTSCGEGTFSGVQGTVSYLFRNQIPNDDFSDLDQNTNLSL